MGSAFVAFYVHEWKNPNSDKSKDIIIEIGKITFRSIIETMELEGSYDLELRGHLDASYGMKWLYVGSDFGKQSYDFGPIFYKALEYLKAKGPPEYYPASDFSLFYSQIADLEKQYLSVRSPPGGGAG